MKQIGPNRFEHVQNFQKEFISQLIVIAAPLNLNNNCKPGILKTLNIFNLLLIV